MTNNNSKSVKFTTQQTNTNITQTKVKQPKRIVHNSFEILGDSSDTLSGDGLDPGRYMDTQVTRRIHVPIGKKLLAVRKQLIANILKLAGELEVYLPNRLTACSDENLRKILADLYRQKSALDENLSFLASHSLTANKKSKKKKKKTKSSSRFTELPDSSDTDSKEKIDSVKGYRRFKFNSRKGYSSDEDGVEIVVENKKPLASINGKRVENIRVLEYDGDEVQVGIPVKLYNKLAAKGGNLHVHKSERLQEDISSLMGKTHQMIKYLTDNQKPDSVLGSDDTYDTHELAKPFNGVVTIGSHIEYVEENCFGDIEDQVYTKQEAINYLKTIDQLPKPVSRSARYDDILNCN